MFYLSKLCFLCLSTYKSYNLELLDTCEGKLIQKKLKYCIPEMTFDSKSEAPKYICRNCIRKIDSSYKFKETCLENSTYLNNYIQLLTSSGNSYKYLTVRLTDVKYDKPEDKTSKEDNDIDVKEEPLFFEDGDENFYRECVKSLKSELEDSDVFSGSENYSDNLKKKKVTVKKKYNYVRRKQQFQCNICDKVYLQKVGLTYHLKVHADIRDFNCDLCQQSFRQKSSLTYHKLSHSGIKRFQCLICKKEFTHKQNLTSHNKIMHLRIRDFECTVCKRRFTHESRLIKHENLHKQIKKFECLVCRKMFLFKCHLVKHEMTHAGIRNFECGTCGKKFVEKHNLRSHEKIHTGIKHFQCLKCNQKFSFRSNLIRHNKTAHGEMTRKFECALCDKKYFHKAHLLQHEIIHTGIKNNECDICKKRFMFKSVLNSHKKIHDKK